MVCFAMYFVIKVGQRYLCECNQQTNGQTDTKITERQKSKETNGQTDGNTLFQNYYKYNLMLIF